MSEWSDRRSYELKPGAEEELVDKKKAHRKKWNVANVHLAKEAMLVPTSEKKVKIVTYASGLMLMGTRENIASKYNVCAPKDVKEVLSERPSEILLSNFGTMEKFSKGDGVRLCNQPLLELVTVIGEAEL